MLLWNAMVGSGCGPVGHWHMSCRLQIRIFMHRGDRVSPPLSFLRATQWPHAKTQWPGALSKIIFFFPVASTLQIAIDELDLRG